MAHQIGFYVPPRYQLLDLAGPLDAFDAANAAAGRQLYKWRVLSRAGRLTTSGAGVRIETAPADNAALDTLLVIGGTIDAMREAEEVAAVQRLAAHAARIASVCTGAFPLAGAGLLDGRRATTHWSRARELQDSFPAVSVEADRIHVADGSLWTSAGITAGIDLALALIEADHGVELARRVARELVVYHRQPGGQSQFSALSQMVSLSEDLCSVVPCIALADLGRLQPCRGDGHRLMSPGRRLRPLSATAWKHHRQVTTAERPGGALPTGSAWPMATICSRSAGMPRSTSALLTASARRAESTRLANSSPVLSLCPEMIITSGRASR